MSSFNVRSRALVSVPVGALQIDNRMGLCLVWWLTQHRWWISAARTAGSFDEFRLASRVPKLYASCSCFSKDLFGGGVLIALAWLVVLEMESDLLRVSEGEASEGLVEEVFECLAEEDMVGDL